MSPSVRQHDIVRPDETVVALVRFAARVAGGTEEAMRAGVAECVASGTPPTWVEEMLLQSYLFCGFPRALNATREWRRSSGVVAPPTDTGALGGGPVEWTAVGEVTCAIVYGDHYAKLRHNIVALHPALDGWMISEGYGKILSRPGLALQHRELCIVAACVAGEQDRQLHSHLHGALNAGVSAPELRGMLLALRGTVSAAALEKAQLLLTRVTGKK